MNKEQTLHQFWSSFGIPAYDENSVPNTVKLPYLTYEVSTGTYNDILSVNTSLWYRDTSWGNITTKGYEIVNTITRGGTLLTYDDGVIWVRLGSPITRRVVDGVDNTIKRIIINIELEFIGE